MSHKKGPVPQEGSWEGSLSWECSYTKECLGTRSFQKFISYESYDFLLPPLFVQRGKTGGRFQVEAPRAYACKLTLSLCHDCKYCSMWATVLYRLCHDESPSHKGCFNKSFLWLVFLTLDDKCLLASDVLSYFACELKEMLCNHFKVTWIFWWLQVPCYSCTVPSILHVELEGLLTFHTF
jgi:hypothetical protein